MIAEMGASMIKQSVIRSAIKMELLGLIGMGLLLVGTHPSLAAPAKCMGKCQAARMCIDLVAQKSLKDTERKVEFNKLYSEPNGL
jgi:hypothetical protein